MATRSSAFTTIVALAFLLFPGCSNSEKPKTISKTETVDGFDVDIVLTISRKSGAESIKVGTAETGSGKPERIVINAKPGFAFVDVDLTVRPKPEKMAEIPRLLAERPVLIDSGGNKYDSWSSVGPYEDKGIKVGSAFEIPDGVALKKVKFGALECEIDVPVPKASK